MYHVVMGKLSKHPKDAYTKGREADITRHLFPRSAQTAWEEIPLMDPRGFPIPLSSEEHALPLRLEELMAAARKLPRDKAPGPDMVQNEVLGVFVREDPEAVLALFNACWSSVAFPRR